MKSAVPHPRTAAELKAVFDIERRASGFLLWRDTEDVQRTFDLAGRDRITIGRRASNSIVIADDEEISRTHAVLELVGGDWTVIDDGLSRNGTFLNGKRINQRRRLKAGDLVRIGRTLIKYYSPGEGSIAPTSAGSLPLAVQNVTETQRRILISLCRPYKTGERHATPASNSQIAAEVFLGVDAVKNHLRVLFQRFDISDLPQNQKRARLVECAFQWGLVAERDL